MLETFALKGLVSFGATLLGKESAKSLKDNISTIDKKFYKAVEKVSKSLQKDYPDVLAGTIESFFTEKEIIDILIKLLFKKSTVNIEEMYEHFDKETLPKDFLEKFVYQLQEELLIDPLFDSILGDIDLYKKINSIEEILRSQTDSFNYDIFFENYKRTLMNNISQINFFGLSLSSEVKKSRKLLEDIYILPRLKIVKESTLKNRKKDSKDSKKVNHPEDQSHETKDDVAEDFLKDTDSEEVNIDEQEIIEQWEKNNQVISFNDLLDKVFTEDKHIVILGNPGAGKSILLKYCMFYIMSDKTSHPIKEYIPFRVELRKFLAFKKQHNKNLTDYIYENLITEYAATHVTKRDIERILSRNKNIVLFDGLDEIFHINDKLEIKRDIENFLITHGNSKGIVTSRSIGYEEAKLNDNFLEVGILEFNDDQIEEYVRNWYSENEVNEKILDEEVDAFLELIKDIDDELSRNPLSLSLIVILYRNNGKLPHSKLEIYRGCTNTLVEEWDDLKELNIELSVKNKKVRVFTKLAYWQYLQLSGKQKKNKTPITNSTVLKEVQKIILSFKNLSEDEDEAQAFAKEFLNYAQKRSIYFDNNFTHKTFHEYYTALYIFQNSDAKGNKDLRDEIINKYITNSYWFIVLELLISMIDEIQGDDDVINSLIETHWSNSNNIKINYFFLKIISHLKNVGEHIVNELIEDSIKKCINEMNIKVEDRNNYARKIFIEIKKLYNTKHYKPIIKKYLKEIYEEVVRQSDKSLKINFHTFFIELDGNTTKEYEAEVRTLVESNSYLYVKFYQDDNNYLEDIIRYIDLFGEDKLYDFIISKFSGTFTLPYIFNYLSNVIHKNLNTAELKESLVTLSKNGLDLRKMKTFFDRFSDISIKNVTITTLGINNIIEEIISEPISS